MVQPHPAASWAPPGLPPATARAARDRRAAAKGAAALVGVGVLYAVLRGVRPEDAGFALGVLGFVAAVGVLLLMKLLRAELLSGPGWLSSRDLFRRRWVRSDQLASVKVSRSGLEHVLVLVDRDGRKAGVVAADLGLNPELRRQLARDVRTSLQNGADVPPTGRALLLDAGPRP